MPFLAPLIPIIAGGLSAAAPILSAAAPVVSSVLPGLTGALAGSSAGDAASRAAAAKVGGQQDAVGNWQDTLTKETGNQSPYTSLGSTSAGDLMRLISGGQFGPGSLGPVPQFTDQFHAPTLDEARNTPGYQFTAQQGTKGILEAAGAAGGAISGGTLRAADSYNTGLADSTYNDVFTRAMAGYNANLQRYGAQLQGFQTGAAAQQQGFNQLFAPTQLGEYSAAGLNQNLGVGATNVGNLMADIGGSRAAGILGQNQGSQQGISALLGSIPGVMTSVGGLLKGLPRVGPPPSTGSGVDPGTGDVWAS